MAGVLDDAAIARVLCITAHPDDIDFGAAGTIARWTEAGIEVSYCVVTDGDAGGFDESFPRSEMPPLRRAEQVAAARCRARSRPCAPIRARPATGMTSRTACGTDWPARPGWPACPTAG
jgi:hypothetical protein